MSLEISHACPSAVDGPQTKQHTNSIIRNRAFLFLFFVYYHPLVPTASTSNKTWPAMPTSASVLSLSPG